MSRWEGWQRTQHDPDTPPDRYQQTLARKVLGELMEGIRLGRLFQNKLTRRFADGTVVIAQFDGTTPMVQVIAPGSSVARTVPVLTSLWIPRGFVFVPGADEAPQGWGLPVRQQPGDTAWPFGDANLAPGLEVTRWTAGGPAAQVLVTRDDTTHYPDERRQMLPIGYDAKEWKASMTSEAKASGWHVVRPTFQGFDWTPDVRGGRMALWRDVTAALDRDLMALPFAGFYDDAQIFASLSAKYGGDDTQWPLDYAGTANRAYKDGYRGAYAEARFANGTAAQLAQGLTLTDGAVLVNVGVSAGITTATERPAKDWIQCGNLFWHPADPALPTLTWDGYPAQNLPRWLVMGGWTGDVGSDIFPLEGWHYTLRGETRHVYSKNLYAMGRCIGVLPDTVISAAIRRETVDAGDGIQKQVNRVVVITWRASDQFGTASGIAYFWRFRLWCVDFDVSADVPLRVADVPVGAYDATTNPTGWRECGAFNVAPHDSNSSAVPPGLPQYTVWQAFRFNGDGARAVAAYGLPPYATIQSGPTRAAEVAFAEIGPDALSYTVNDSVVDVTANGFLMAADYDAEENIAYVWDDTQPYDAEPPTGGTDAVTHTLRWSGGGEGEIAGWAGFGVAFTPDKWVLDARTGAMAITSHWLVCSGTGAPAISMYEARLAINGARAATDQYVDSAQVAEQAWTSDSFLDRLNAGFARDRDGHVLMGYDLGTTADVTPVYVSQVVCGQPFPATAYAAVSSYFGSRWLFDGQPIDLEGLPDAPMRAFPLGVC